MGHPSLSAVPTADDFATCLQQWRQVWSRSDFRAAARQHARGKLTVREKLEVLFDPGTFEESMAPSPDLEPRHGERRLLTGRGQMHGRPVAAALFDSSIAAGSVTISTGRKLIAHMQQPSVVRC